MYIYMYIQCDDGVLGRREGGREGGERGEGERSFILLRNKRYKIFGGSSIQTCSNSIYSCHRSFFFFIEHRLILPSP